VVAAAYTSVSFMASVSGMIKSNQRIIIISFMLLSTLLFIFLGSPTKLLVKAGTINGLVLPVALASILWVVIKRKGGVHERHPKWLLYTGWTVVVLLAIMGVRSVWLMG
jgi:Mn2+/Fe2+ NRAMP family transporter